MVCPICKNTDFQENTVLIDRLISEWGLNQFEVDYINKQQGFTCTLCNSNLRSMTLASNIIEHYGLKCRFIDIHKTRFGRKRKLLELNQAGNLHNMLEKFKNHVFAEFPEVDIQALPYDKDEFDIVIHSDTLEHIKNPLTALKECYRVLKPGGVLFYTIPIIYGRMTRRRDLLSNSYHGIQNEQQGEDFKVWTEYGADFWVEIIKAGFKKISLYSIDDLSSISICAQK